MFPGSCRSHPTSIGTSIIGCGITVGENDSIGHRIHYITRIQVVAQRSGNEVISSGGLGMLYPLFIQIDRSASAPRSLYTIGKVASTVQEESDEGEDEDSTNATNNAPNEDANRGC